MFLSDPTIPEAIDFLEQCRNSDGYVQNLARAWAWRPDVLESFAGMRKVLNERSTLTERERALLVCCTARALEDSYCSVARGTTLASLTTPELARDVLQHGYATGLSPRERALARWARRVVTDPNATTQGDVNGLREAGLSDQEIMEATVFIAFRLAFSHGE